MERKGQVSGVSSKGKSYLIKPEQLVRRWRTSLECARRTIEKTEQRALRDWRTVRGDRHFALHKLKYPRLNCEVFCDIKFGLCKSLEGNKCLAIYATRFQWATASPLSEKRYVHQSLSYLFRDVGFPSALIPDGASSLTQGEFRRIANKAQRFMSGRNIPKLLWDQVFIYCLEIRSHMALGHPSQNGECGAIIIHGRTACEFILLYISHLVGLRYILFSLLSSSLLFQLSLTRFIFFLNCSRIIALYFSRLLSTFVFHHHLSSSNTLPDESRMNYCTLTPN